MRLYLKSISKITYPHACLWHLSVLVLLALWAQVGHAATELVQPPAEQSNADVEATASPASIQQVLGLTVESWNTTEEVQLHELSRTLNLTVELLHARPGLPRHFPELQIIGAAEFLATILGEHPVLHPERVGAWAKAVLAFLDRHTQTLPPLSAPKFDQGPTYRHSQRNRNARANGGATSTTSTEGVFGLSAVEAARLSGLPLVRRVVLAQLLHAWLGHWGRRAPRGMEEAVGDVVRMLYGIHMASVVRRGMVEYLHISKSGGSSFSAAARHSGCAMRRRCDGRVEALDDRCRWVNRSSMSRRTGKHLSGWAIYGEVARDTAVRGCPARAAFVASSGYSYISNEYTLHGGRQDMYDTHTCPQFVGVVTLREPHDRITSHLRYLLVKWAANNFMNSTVEAGGPKAVGQLLCSNWQGAEYPQGLWEEMLPPVADNYMTRTFLGESGFHLPVGSVTRQHAALARALLLQFDLVLDLNAGQELGDRLLQHGLGWGTTLAELQVRSSENVAKVGGIPPDYCLPAGLDSLLASGRQAPDQELYRFGAALTRLDFLFFSAARALGLRPESVLGLPPHAHIGTDGEGGAAGTTTAQGQCGVVALVWPPPVPGFQSSAPVQ